MHKPLATLALLIALVGFTNARAEDGTLIGLMAERLDLGKEVAWAKFNTGAPVYDAAREKAVLDDLVAQARRAGLTAAAATGFFTAQIKASREVQTEAITSWKSGAPRPAGKPLDLKKDLRPRLDDVDHRLLAALAANPGLLENAKRAAAAEADLHWRGFSAATAGFAIQPGVSGAAEVASPPMPVLMGIPYPMSPQTLAEVMASSPTPFFTLGGKTPPILAAPPAKLEDRQVLKLWPGQAPLQQGDDPAVDVPTLTVFLPPAGKATGAVVIIYPGGGYSKLSPREVFPATQWLPSNGITAFVLKYRTGMKYHHPAPLDDAQRAIRYVRANAGSWGLDPDRIGVLGFSAGAHLGSVVATHFEKEEAAADPIDRLSSRPDLQILLYPPITFTDESILHAESRRFLLGDNPSAAEEEFLSSDRHVSADTPPAFIVQSTQDMTVPVANADLYAAALGRNNIPFVYIRGPFGRHGFGVTDNWSGEAIAWMRKLGF